MTEPIANIKQGQLKGITGTDLNGENFFKFLGIPYGKPPVGSLRFKAPQPAEPWSGVLDASREGNSCISFDALQGKMMGSEDCLYLNVFTKVMPGGEVNSKPVIVCIHGGGFVFGDGGEMTQGPKYLIAQDIVLVTPNYRVGIWGFLSSDDLSLETPGNAGLKDQVLALKWVQENIASFNGDPNNVTIIGSSAGGASVHFQVLSSSAKGLFHKAIAQSGTALNPWAWGQRNMIQVANKMSKKASNDREALDTLMKASAEELFTVCQEIKDAFFNANKRRPFGPVIEKPNPTALLTENPTDLLESGKFNQVPTIYGICSNEGLLYEYPHFAKDINPKEISAFWSLGQNEEKREKIKTLVNEFYFRNGESNEAIHEVVGDVNFHMGAIESAKLAAKTSHSPVYLYVFDYVNSLTEIMWKIVNIDSKYKGITHGGEIPFLFNGILINEIPDEEVKNAIKMVTKIWADFARTGKPHENWLPVTDVNELKYFHITANPELKEKPFGGRIAIWERVFKEIATFDARVQEGQIC